MMVTNPADAMIMCRLFTALIDDGVAIVTTSQPPAGGPLQDGLNRELFLPFIALIEARMEVRRRSTARPITGSTGWRGSTPGWCPTGPRRRRKLSEAFFRLTDYPVEDRAHVPTEELDVGGGRTLHVPKSLKGVAVFSFKRLCGEARGAADYLAIARRFHTVIIVGIPMMTRENAQRGGAVRDADRRALRASRQTARRGRRRARRALPGGRRHVSNSQRTVSRLEEMQSADYLGEGHGAARGLTAVVKRLASRDTSGENDSCADSLPLPSCCRRARRQSPTR